MIEEMLRDFQKARPSFNVAVLRYFNPIGAHESGMIGEDPEGPPNNLVPYITQVLAGRRERLAVFGDDYDTPDGSGLRDYIHVVDLVAAHVQALKVLENSPGLTIFNLGTGRAYSVFEVIKTFERVAGKKIPFELQGRRSGDVAAVYADASRARELLGWQARYDLEKMCRDSWHWQEKNPKGYASR
jgi:UDP-glucose 4-epimerase